MGSTLFKEGKDEKGKVRYYRCAVCGYEYKIGEWSQIGYESHEIMHLLQIMRSQVSGGHCEPIFEEAEE